MLGERDRHKRPNSIQPCSYEVSGIRKPAGRERRRLAARGWGRGTDRSGAGFVCSENVLELDSGSGCTL